MEKYICVDCKIEMKQEEVLECRGCGEAICNNCACERDGYCASCFEEDKENIIKEYLKS